MKVDTSVINELLDIADSLLNVSVPKSISYSKKSLELSKELSYEKGVGKSHLALGNIRKKQQNYPDALSHYILARDIFSQRGEKLLLAKTYNKLGIVYQKTSNHDNALNYYEKAADIFQQTDTASYAGTLNNIGLIYFIQSDYGEAINHLSKSLVIREKLGDKPGIAANYNNIGNIYYLQGNYQNAFDYYNNSLKIKKEIGDSANLANSYLNIANIYKLRNEYDSAKSYLNRSLLLNTKLQNTSGIVNTLITIGDVLHQQEKIDEALSHYNLALEKSESLPHKNSRLHALHGKGLCYSSLNNYPAAIEALNKALVLAREIGSKEKVKDLFRSLSDAYEASGDYKKSLEYYKKYKRQNDSLIKLKNKKQLAEAEAKYNVEKKQQEIDILKKKNAFKELKLEKNELINYAFATGIFFLLIILIIIYRNNHQKQRNNELLQSKNESIKKQKEEKEVLVKEIHHRVKNNLQVIVSLLRLQSSFSGNERVKKLFEESENRVLSMSLIHEKLYQSKDLSKIKIDGYIRELVENLINTYRLNLDVELETEIDDISFDVNTLIPVGLLLNEIISNSLKYAFENKAEAKVFVILKKEDDKYILRVGDNGKGLPENLNQDSTSLGLELIDTFTEQLNGEKTVSVENGTTYTIIFR